MFDHDLDQTLLVLLGPLGVLFLFPFAMAWLERSLDSPSSKRLHSWAPWMVLGRVPAQRRRR